MISDGIEILLDAIARNSAAVLTLPSAGMLRHHKSRLLAEEAGQLWIESTASDRPLIDDLIGSQSPVGVSFRAGGQKVSFVAPIIRREPQYRMNAQTILEALLLPFPTDVRVIQRRNNYRVRVPEDSDLSIRIWRIPEHVVLTDKPLASAEVLVKLRDLSTGGVGVYFVPKGEEPPRIVAGERLRIALRYQENDDLIFEGRLLYFPPLATDKMPARAGVQFKKLENDLEGRQNIAALTKIVGELQRGEVRRMRLGIKAA